MAIRGNWVYTRVWRWFADATTYATLFITTSGIYLWFALKAERRVGVALLSAGMLTFVGTAEASRRTGRSIRVVQRAAMRGQIVARRPHPRRLELEVGSLDEWNEGAG